MSKGEATRQAILAHALGLASRVGFEGLTIGRLAEDLEMSKSGLFAHFRSKEALQLEVLGHAADRFVDAVVRPALRAPRGERRLRALVERWMAWEQSDQLPGGCPLVGAAFELDDRPGPVRDFLVQTQRDWHDTIATVARGAVQEGELRTDLDCDQFAHDLAGVFLAYTHASRLMRDPRARARTERAFEALIAAARPPAAAAPPAAEPAAPGAASPAPAGPARRRRG